MAVFIVLVAAFSLSKAKAHQTISVYPDIYKHTCAWEFASRADNIFLGSMDDKLVSFNKCAAHVKEVLLNPRLWPRRPADFATTDNQIVGSMYSVDAKGLVHTCQTRITKRPADRLSDAESEFLLKYRQSVNEVETSDFTDPIAGELARMLGVDTKALHEKIEANVAIECDATS